MVAEDRDFDPSPEEPYTGPHRRLRILLVEDEILIRMWAAETLRDAGYETIEAAHGEEAMSLLAAGLAFDLLITDIRMPGTIGGISLLELATASYPELPVLVASSHVPDVTNANLKAAFLPKPYSEKALIGTVRALIGSR